MKLRYFFVLIFAAALAASAAVACAASRPDVGGPFSLIDQDGARVTQKTFLGEPVLLYFGFTTCPDVCPLDLAKMAGIARRIRVEAGVDVTPVFVSIDPERDTPAKLKPYVRMFAKDFIGLTGTPQEIARIGDEYHVYYKKVPMRGGGYMMDHSTVLFLLGADGAYLDHYGRALSIDEITGRAVAKLKAPSPSATAEPASDRSRRAAGNPEHS